MNEGAQRTPRATGHRRFGVLGALSALAAFATGCASGARSEAMTPGGAERASDEAGADAALLAAVQAWEARSPPRAKFITGARVAARTISELPTERHHVGTRRRIDVRFDDADLANAFRMLADVGAFGLVIEGDVGGPVAVALRGVSPYDALVTLAEAHGLAVTRSGDVVIVTGR